MKSLFINKDIFKLQKVQLNEENPLIYSINKSAHHGKHFHVVNYSNESKFITAKNNYLI